MKYHYPVLLLLASFHFLEPKMHAQIPPTIEWSETYGGTKVNEPYAIWPTTDGGYIVAGYTSSNDGDVSNSSLLGKAWIIKLDAQGGLEWEQAYENGLTAYDIQQTNEGGILWREKVAQKQQKAIFGSLN